MITTITTAERALCETVAFVTMSLMDELEAWPEQQMPGAYRFHVFSGFPGFADHAAAAGLALSRVLAGHDLDHLSSFFELTDGFARLVIGHAVNTGTPADNLTLRQLGEKAFAAYLAEMTG